MESPTASTPPHVADLFLLDRWDYSSVLPLAEQRASIFAEFVRMGSRGRQTFEDHIRAQGAFRPGSSLSSADQALLASVRPSSERMISAPSWLRTYYRDHDGNSTDAAHEALKKSTEEFYQPHPEGMTHVLDDAMLYDYGPEDWQRIFTRIPELLFEKNFTADYYEQRKARAVEAAIEADEEEDAELEEQGYTKSEDGLHWSEMFQGVQHASAVGEIWIADEEAINSGKLLMAWFDDCGRVIRWVRMPGEDIDGMLGRIFEVSDNEHGAWRVAEVGPDYDWDGICGPPYRSS
ncbi:hypothetical protein MMC17_007869 [Xylographa soralifera]|nr:hypothetical protein [Xylographa soralifera]